MTRKQLTLRSVDIPTFQKYTVGFSNIFDELTRIDNKQTDNYPPYNIVQYNLETEQPQWYSDECYEIQLAVAGFSPDELHVTEHKNMLVIEGIRNQSDNQITYLYRGIANRDFKREFRLSDHVVVTGTKLGHGILTIYLKKEIPEEEKPKKIEITYTK